MSDAALQLTILNYTSMLKQYALHYSGPDEGDQLLPMKLKPSLRASVAAVEEATRSKRSSSFARLLEHLDQFEESANDALNHRLGIAFTCIAPLKVGWNAFPILLSLSAQQLKALAQKCDDVFENFPRIPWNAYHALDRAAFLVLRDIINCAASWNATDAQQQRAAQALDNALFWSRRCGTGYYADWYYADQDEVSNDKQHRSHRPCPPPDELLSDESHILRRLRMLEAADRARLRDIVGQLVRFIGLDCENEYAAPRHLYRVASYENQRSLFTKFLADQFGLCAGNRWIEILGCEIVGMYFLIEENSKARHLPLPKRIRSFARAGERAILTTDFGNILEKEYPRI